MPTRRQVFEARVRRRSVLIAAGSTLSRGIGRCAAGAARTGLAGVKKSFFNAEVFAKTLPGLLDAFLLDVAIFPWSAPLIFLLGLADRIVRGMCGHRRFIR